MANTPRPPILGAFEDLGEQIVSQVKNIPKDVGQTALESLGMGNSSTQGQKTQQPQAPGMTQQEGSNWQQIDATQDVKIKKEIARQALAELLQPTSNQKEPSIWEKIQQEEEQKKAQAVEAQKKQAPINLPTSGARKVPGIKSAIKAKTNSAEMKNTRQD